MAEEHVGPRPAAWTRIFSGFKVALDLKKLLLAGAGILFTALGWWALSCLAYNFHPVATKPEWERDYAHRAKDTEDKANAWTDFKTRRASWNLLHELAGDGPIPVEPADVAQNLPEYEALSEIKTFYTRYQDERFKVTAGKDKELNLEVGTKKYPFTIVNDPRDLLKDRDKDKSFPLRDLRHEIENQFQISQGADVVTINVTQNATELRKYRDEAGSLVDLRNRIQTYDLAKRKDYEAALKTFEAKFLPRDRDAPIPEKAGGLLRAWPWFEYRGENPYLLVTHLIKEANAEQSATQPASLPRGHLLARFAEMIPVLLEPIVKLLTPIVYLFHRAADWYVRIYLILVLLWAIATWGFFGGAITRLAAVQIARNEKIPLREALLFAKDRFLSFFAAPAFPLLLLGILVVALWVFGWVEGFTYFFGDIVVAGLLWPIVLIVGLIMAVVLVGLVGWPLMNATISAEGSDSFDALSRSYSYVYQAPWHYLWYALLATLYGAVLVFFVGFMASLIVFLGKWGVGMTPGIGSSNPANDREPSYLFMYAPTSFGWRDLLIHNSAFVEPKTEFTPSGLPAVHYEFNQAYRNNISWSNRIGAALVSIWIYLFFLLVVGFGYSYFWTAATIIYFLMRQQVDDTDLDEVHLEEDELADPFGRPSTPPGTPAAPGTSAGTADPKSDKVSLSMVDAPTLRTSVPPVPPVPLSSSPAPPPPVATTPPPPTAPFAPMPPVTPPVTPPGLTTSTPTPDELPPSRFGGEGNVPSLPDKERHEPPTGAP